MVVLQKRKVGRCTGGRLHPFTPVTMSKSNPFKWRHYPAPKSFYVAAGISAIQSAYRQVAEMVNERGLGVHYTTIYGWVQEYGPEIDKRCRPHLKLTNDSWRVDQTYIKVKKEDKYLDRAVDSAGNTIALLTALA